ncbi:MAG: polysaccharide export protein [Acidobacteriia bacterium]|nr:polysaccharide export protein [Terriglobia bacterium]
MDWLRVLQALLGIALFLIADSVGAQVRPVAEAASTGQGEFRQISNRTVNAIPGAEANALAEIKNDESRVGPGDLLDITVFEAPEMNRTLRVSASGEISMELLGAVKASGLTPRELESALRDRLRRTYMKDPHVGVFVRELESHPVSVVGAVKKPGVFQIQGTKTVLEMLSMAEGPAEDAGESVLIMRGAAFSGANDSSSPEASQESNGKIDAVNLWSLMESRNAALNLPVYPGDIVKVTSAELVYVVGEVKKPGGFALKNNQSISLLQALALAEGLTHTAATGQARIVRTDPRTGQRVEIPVNLGRILANKSSDPGLQPKDIFFIPNSSAKSAFYRGAESAVSMATGVAIYKW